MFIQIASKQMSRRVPPSTYFAHSNELPNQQDWHLLSDHLEGTGERAAAFLESTGCGDFGRAAGLLHDLGKYTREFQKRLAGGPRCDHATAGAKVAIDQYREPFGKMLAFCIAGHHAGLANGVNGERISALADRLDSRVPSLDPTWRDDITLEELALPRLTVSRLLEELNWVKGPGGCARQLQPYVVQIPPFVRTALLAAGAAEIVRKDRFADQFVVLANSALYRKDIGLTWNDPTFRKAEGLLF